MKQFIPHGCYGWQNKRLAEANGRQLPQENQGSGKEQSLETADPQAAFSLPLCRFER